MPTTQPIREVVMSEELAALVKEFAYQNRKTVSVVMKEFVERFAEKGFTGIRKPQDKPEHRGKTRVGFVMDGELWKAAEDKAWELRMNRSACIRIVAAEATKKVEVPQ